MYIHIQVSHVITRRLVHGLVHGVCLRHACRTTVLDVSIMLLLLSYKTGTAGKLSLIQEKQE